MDDFVNILFIFLISLMFKGESYSKIFSNLIYRNAWQTIYFFNYKANHLNLEKSTKFWKLAQNGHKFITSAIPATTLQGSQILTIALVTPPIPILKHLHPTLQILQFRMILSTWMHYILVGMYDRTTKKLQGKRSGKVKYRFLGEEDA
ncbi:hypothetical protein GIB67_038623 [Kingdonia uniflora]|uniref:Uncharacterized protein n=1 Tax=Kingdonia uniflora TaxID=39325 RepID=A0A7J7NPM8_9MAGN|nr:hypothetical protein GIB67_038623 [Kingdonia uniflora]